MPELSNARAVEHSKLLEFIIRSSQYWLGARDETRWLFSIAPSSARSTLTTPQLEFESVRVPSSGMNVSEVSTRGSFFSDLDLARSSLYLGELKKKESVSASECDDGILLQR